MPDRIAYCLLPHPELPNAGGMAIEVTVYRSAAGLALSYRITGDTDAIRLPPPAGTGPADGLWQHTCCEAFLATENGTEYREFNFSPSGQWACYRFSDYRQRDDSFVPDAIPTSEFWRLDDGFQLRASIPAALLPPGPMLRLGLTAVIEAADGRKDYWALAHAAERPDFHLRQTFTLSLSRP